MSLEKKLIRKRFRDLCYARDKLTCVMCGLKVSSIEEAEKILDVHHITNPKKIINGGYVPENGISLCSDCHLKAEEYHSTGTSFPGYSPDDLYKVINSNIEKATQASIKLK